MSDERLERGLKVTEKLFGRPSMLPVADGDPANAKEFARLITEHCFADSWSRSGVAAAREWAGGGGGASPTNSRGRGAGGVATATSRIAAQPDRTAGASPQGDTSGYPRHHRHRSDGRRHVAQSPRQGPHSDGL